MRLIFQGRFEEAVAMGRKAIADNGFVKAPLNALALSLALAAHADRLERFRREAKPSPPSTTPASSIIRE